MFFLLGRKFKQKLGRPINVKETFGNRERSALTLWHENWKSNTNSPVPSLVPISMF